MIVTQVLERFEMFENLSKQYRLKKLGLTASMIKPAKRSVSPSKAFSAVKPFLHRIDMIASSLW